MWNLKIEKPSDLIYDFKGLFESQEKFENLSLKHTIWANMKIVSSEAIGVVIYVGKETRIELNNK